MSPPEPTAACERLIGILERARALAGRTQADADDSIRPPLCSLALAELRMRIGPALDPQAQGSEPVHVVLFGGTNAGKSTILNVLIGGPGAVMGARARLSQHPAAYRSREVGDRWLEAAPGRFRSYQLFRNELPPRQSDAELRAEGYRPALAVVDLENLSPAPAAAGIVFWDAPDYSTEEARTYLGTVLDVSALADLIVVAVTDEAYADHRGNLLLALLAEAGAEFAIAANKVPESQALLDDIARTLETNAGVRAPVVRLPFVAGATPEERLTRLLSSPEAARFRDVVRQLAERGRRRKAESISSAVGFVQRHWDELVRPLAEEAEEAAAWDEAVARITEERLLGLGRRLGGGSGIHQELDRLRAHLRELVAIPGLGPALELAGRLVRVPLRWVAQRAGIRRRQTEGPGEQELLEDAFRDWLAALKAEAQARAAGLDRPAWLELARRLDHDDFRRSAQSRFQLAAEAYHASLDAAVRRRAESLAGTLRANPLRLTSLRAANAAGCAGSVILAYEAVGLDWWLAATVPVLAGLWQNVVEWGIGRYLETQSAGLRQEQLEALRAAMEANLAQPARELFPGSGGSCDLEAAGRDLGLVREAAARLRPGGGDAR